MVQKAPEQAKKQTPNLTGIPTQMKLDFERRSGLSFDDVRVHYNSEKPRKIGALAYTQIPQVHIGPGQERHLQHELVHVVQQKQGIVRPTIWINGLPVNDSPELESAADSSQYYSFMPVTAAHSQAIVQGYFEIDYGEDNIWFSPAVSRPNQQSLVQKTFDSKSGISKAICHIISDKFIQQALMMTLLHKLNNEKYLPTYDMKAPKEKRQMTELRNLVKAVIPSKLNLSEEYKNMQTHLERFSFLEYYESSLKQRQNALTLVDGIDKLFGVSTKRINPLELSVKTSALYDILSNALGNLKIGYSNMNNSIQSRIDPVSSALELVDGEGGEKTIKIVSGHPYNMESKVSRLTSLIQSLAASGMPTEKLTKLTDLLSFSYKRGAVPQSGVGYGLRSGEKQQSKAQVSEPLVHYRSSDFSDKNACRINWLIDSHTVPFGEIKFDRPSKQHHTLPELKPIIKDMQEMATRVQFTKFAVEWLSIQVRNAKDFNALTKAHSDVQAAKSKVLQELTIVSKIKTTLLRSTDQLKVQLADITEKERIVPAHDSENLEKNAQDKANCIIQLLRVKQLLTNIEDLDAMMNQFLNNLDTASNEANSKLCSADHDGPALKRARTLSEMGASTNATSLQVR